MKEKVLKKISFETSRVGFLFFKDTLKAYNVFKNKEKHMM